MFNFHLASKLLTTYQPIGILELFSYTELTEPDAFSMTECKGEGKRTLPNFRSTCTKNIVELTEVGAHVKHIPITT